MPFLQNKSNSMLGFNRFSIFLLLGIFFFTSCKSVRVQDVTYFTNLPDSVKEISISRVKYYPPVIEKDDNLNIVIQTIDPTSTISINQGNLSAYSTALTNLGVIGTSGASTGAVTGSASMINGFIVDSKGVVDLPLLGKIVVAGLTIEQAKDSIRQFALKYYQNPTVSVQFTNFRISVLGEVARPSTYVVPSAKVSVLDAIGFAGDLSIYGRRDNILLIRHDSSAKEKFVRLNLNSTDIFSSPYFYLKQNDIIYVQPNKSRVTGSDVISARALTYLSIALTLIIAISGRIR